MQEIVVFTYIYPAPPNLEERIKKIMDVARLPYVYYNIPQVDPGEIIKSKQPKTIIVFGDITENLVREAANPTIRIITLPTLNRLEACKENKEIRQATFEKLQDLRSLIEAPPSLLSGEINIPKVTLEEALGTLASKNKVSYTISYQDKILEITDNPSGLSDLYLTPYDIGIIKLIQETLGASLINIKRMEK